MTFLPVVSCPSLCPYHYRALCWQPTRAMVSLSPGQKYKSPSTACQVLLHLFLAGRCSLRFIHSHHSQASQHGPLLFLGPCTHYSFLLPSRLFNCISAVVPAVISLQALPSTKFYRSINGQLSLSDLAWLPPYSWCLTQH
jgi:hypothetical protein